jgi:hypothetical protein
MRKTASTYLRKMIKNSQMRNWTTQSFKWAKDMNRNITKKIYWGNKYMKILDIIGHREIQIRTTMEYHSAHLLEWLMLTLITLNVMRTCRNWSPRCTAGNGKRCSHSQTHICHIRWPFPPRHSPMRNKSICPHKVLHMNVHRNFVRSSPKLEKAQMFINR